MITRILGVDPVPQEVKSGETATISCVVNGLTAALTDVKWKNAAGTLVTDASISGNHEALAGTLEGDSQTTTLKVVATGSTDTTYTCVITSDEWAQTNVETTVSLDVFGT